MTKHPYQLNVLGLTAALEAVGQDLPLRLACGLGVGSPGSYRGFYGDVALRPEMAGTVGDALAEIKALKEVHGYKGGRYEVRPETAVWISDHSGCTGVYPVGVRVVEIAGERCAVIDTAWEAK